MKVKKNNTVKLEAGEVRLGNFFLKPEAEHFKIQDLNSVFTHRVWRRIPAGLWIHNMLSMPNKEGHESLRVYIAVLWSLFSVVPDDQFIRDVMDITKAALERHPDWYGAQRDDSEDADAEAVEQVKAMKEFEEMISKVGDAAE